VAKTAGGDSLQRVLAWARGRAGIVTIVAVLALAAVLLAMRSRSAGAPLPARTGEAVPLVSVMQPGLSAVSGQISFTGSILARHEMPVGVEGDGGRIASVRVDVGDEVRRGQILATLDTSVTLPQVERLAASLEEARATADLRDAEYERAQGVEAAGALSTEEIARRRSAAVTARAQVKVAEAQLAEARARLARTQIRAPDDGLVLTRQAEVGQTATAGGEPLFRLARDGQVELRGQVAEQDMPRLAAGQRARVRLTGVTAPFEGKVRLVGAVIDPQTRLGEVRIALDAHPNLRPGAFARGEVEVSSTERPVVPQTAVLSDPRGTYVFVVGEDDHVVRRAVRVSGTDPKGVVIAEGLTGRERVVTTAGAFLREGERVEVAAVEPGAEPAAAGTPRAAS
jgi:RND family efflux transporter MFP subunit